MTWAQRLKRVFGIDIETCPACGGAVRVIALRIRWSSERFSPIWMRKWLSPKPPGGRRAGRRRSGGCSTGRGDNPRMNSFGLWHQRREDKIHIADAMLQGLAPAFGRQRTSEKTRRS